MPRHAFVINATDFNFWFITLLSYNLAKLLGFLVFSHIWVGYISHLISCNPNFNLGVNILRSFHFLFSFLSSLSSFSPFLGCQTPSKDDNLEDERLKPLPS